MASRRTSLSDYADLAIAREIDSKYDDVKTVADNIEHIITDSINIEPIKIVSENINVVLGAQAIIENIDEILLADNNAIIAATKAEEAALSAESALTSATSAEEVRVDVTSSLNTVIELSTNATVAAQVATTESASASLSAGLANASAVSASESASSASTSEVNASTSEVNAATSANNAMTSEYNALASATQASTSETNAAISESNAATSASSSASNASLTASHLAAIETIYDSFDDRYLGVFASEPLTDNDGNALIIGAIYFDSVLNHTKFYNGVSWEDPELSAIEAADTAIAKALEASVSASNALVSETTSALNASNALASEQAAALSETNASTYESNAIISANSAASSASNAAIYSSNAYTSEQNAAVSANAALVSEQNAASSEAVVLSAKNVVDTLVLGAFASDPLVDSNGDPLVSGAIYYNTTIGSLMLYTGSVWVTAAFDATNTVLSFNGRKGAITLSYTDVINALEFDPANRSNHTGTQLSSTISDFDTTVSNNIDVSANTSARHTHTNKSILDLVDQDVSSDGTPSFNSVKLNGGTGAQGTLSWNTDDETLDLVLNGSVLQIGQEMHLHVTKHSSVADIVNGTPVIAMGTTGGSGKILVGAATLANWQIVVPGATEVPAMRVIGIATEDITNNGPVTAFGKVNEIPGANFTNGATQYVDTINGTLSDIRPTSGLVMPIAFAINSNTLMVRVTAINELDIEKGVTAFDWGNHILAGYELASNKGIANGYASLDSNGIIPSSQLPSYVDDVLEYTSISSFPTSGETGKIYVALDSNKTYRWSGSTYIYITSGAVDSVAGKTGVVTLVKGDVGLGLVNNTADNTKNVLSATKLTTARTIGGVSFDGTANISIPFSGLSSKPTTLSGYGITDAYTKTEVDAALSVLLNTTWN